MSKIHGNYIYTIKLRCLTCVDLRPNPQRNRMHEMCAMLAGEWAAHHSGALGYK